MKKTEQSGPTLFATNLASIMPAAGRMLGETSVVRAAKAEAMQRVDANADGNWRATTDSVIRMCAGRYPEFTTDNVHAALVLTGAKTHEMRALGPAMSRAARRGIIEATDRYEQSLRRECHGRPVRLWRSRIYIPTSE